MFRQTGKQRNGTGYCVARLSPGGQIKPRKVKVGKMLIEFKLRSCLSSSALPPGDLSLSSSGSRGTLARDQHRGTVCGCGGR